MNLMKIKSIKKIKNNSKRYDIQIKNNNNFFANGILVHNSMLELYNDNSVNNWLFATRKCPEAEGQTELGRTFSDIAHEALKVMGIDFVELQKKLNRNYTYMFEMVSPYTKVYIFYPKPKLILLGVRDNVSLKELDPKPIARELGFPVPREYPLTDIKSLIFLVNTWNGTEQEGVVVVDKYFNRIKIKNEDYVAGQGLVFSLACSNRNVIQLIMNGHEDDVLPQCGDLIKEKILRYKDIFISLVKSIEKDWDEIKHIDNQKEYALIAKTKPWSGILFDLKKGKVSSVETYLRKNARVDYILKLCGLDNEKEIEVKE